VAKTFNFKMSIPFAKPYFSTSARKNIQSGIDKILSSGRLMMGEFTKNFETDFASYIGTSKAVTTNTCTTALQISLTHFDVQDAEVLVPAASFLTDISSVRWAGGTPVLVDIDPQTLSFDLEDLERKLTPKTKGIIWVHLTGVISSSWREIVALARKHDLFIIEDCAHAHGSSIEGVKAGAIGDVGCFSFYPTKVMTTGTGGMITTNDRAIEKSAKELRLFGRENGTGPVVREGNDWFMDEIRACLGFYQLQELDTALAKRRKIAESYNEKLKDIPGLKLLDIPKDTLPSWYFYSVFVGLEVDYEHLVKNLKEIYGIPTQPIYPPLHQEKIFLDFDDGSLRKTEEVLNRSLCLPLFLEIDDSQIDQVVKALRAEMEKAR
jgi:perosamine synthetase